MVRSKKKKVLSQTELQNIREERDQLQSVLNEAETAGIGTPAEQINKTAIKQKIKYYDKEIEVGQPPKLTGSQKDGMARREKELEDIFREGLPTKYEMDHPARCPGAVRKHQKWDSRTKQYIEEWRTVQRSLHPGEERSIEQLRQDGARSKYI